MGTVGLGGWAFEWRPKQRILISNTLNGIVVGGWGNQRASCFILSWEGEERWKWLVSKGGIVATSNLAVPEEKDACWQPRSRLHSASCETFSRASGVDSLLIRCSPEIEECGFHFSVCVGNYPRTVIFIIRAETLSYSLLHPQYLTVYLYCVSLIKSCWRKTFFVKHLHNIS